MDRFSVHHQESSTIYTAIGICHTGFADCLLAYIMMHGPLNVKLRRLCLTVLYFLLWSTELYTRFVSSQTHGRIQLRFTDLKGDTLMVTRLMKLTQKAKNLEFKTIDASLSRKSSNGEVSSSFLVL